MRTLILLIAAIPVLTSITIVPARAAEPSPAPSLSAAPPFSTASGLQYVDLELGSGPTPKPGQNVAIEYTISLDGKRIAGSRAGQPMVFAIDRDQAMKGLNEGVSTMKVGGHRTLTVPPALGYGSAGVDGRVPPNATLLIDVHLLEIRK